MLCYLLNTTEAGVNPVNDELQLLDTHTALDDALQQLDAEDEHGRVYYSIL